MDGGSQKKAVEVFYSYAHKDESWRNELEKHLSSLRRQNLIKDWYDRRITAGMNWAHTIDIHLNTASIILLLVSSDFIASDYCYGIEMARAMERHAANDAHVIPIILRPVDWQETPFAKLQALPSNGKAIAQWRHRDQAFLDITRAIRKIIEDSNLPPPAPPATQSQIWHVPHRRNLFFTGQEPILAHLQNNFNKDAILRQPQAISGLGGIGKTQIAIEYAYRHRDQYHAVLWVNADTHESLTLDFAALATHLHLPTSIAQDHHRAIEEVKIWLETHDRWLLIFDNADDITMVQDFLPSPTKGHILLTTRAQAHGTIARGIEVKQMDMENAALFLLRRAKMLAHDETLAHAPATDCELVKEIAQELGGLPLALDQAGAFIEETGCNLATYQDYYHHQHTTLLQRRGKLAAGHPESVATTWSLSFEKIEQASPAAADLLRFCAFLHPDAIPEEIFIVGARELGPTLRPLAHDLIALDEIMEILRAYSLIQRDANENTLTIHRLVQTVLKDGMSKSLQRQWAARAVHAINRVFPDAEYITDHLAVQRYILQAKTCATLIEEWQLKSKAALRLLNETGEYLHTHAQFDDAESLLQLALTLSQQVFAPDPPRIAISLNNLASLYWSMGKYAQAEPLHQRALSIRQQALGPDHPDVATSLLNLAVLYYKQGKYTRVEPLYQQALSILEQHQETEPIALAVCRNNLAEFYRSQGKYHQAEQLYQQALMTYEQTFEAKHPDIAITLNNLAKIYLEQGQYKQATSFLHRALAINEQTFGPEHPNVATDLGVLAYIYAEQGFNEQAEQFHQRALSIKEQAFGLDHPSIVINLNGLAVGYTTQGKFEQAEAMLQRALTFCEQTLDPNHTDIAATLNNLASLYSTQKKYELAETTFLRMLSIYEQTLGPNHPDVVRGINNLVATYTSQEKYDLAEPLLQRAFSILEQTIGLDHPRAALTFCHQAIVYEAQGKYEEAEYCYRRSLLLFEQSEADHPAMSTTMVYYADFLRSLQRDEEAIALEEHAQKPQIQKISQKHD